MSRPVARASAPSGTGGRSEAVDVSGDTISMKATAGKVSGNWKSKNISGRDVMVWDAKESNYEKPQDGQSISFDMKVPKSGTYTINLDSARVRSVMGAGEKYIKHAGNDAFVKVTDMDTGEVVLKPEKLFTFFGDTDEKFNVGDEFSKGHNTRSAVVNLDAGGNYKFEVIGRSDGYALNEVKLKRKS